MGKFVICEKPEKNSKGEDISNVKCGKGGPRHDDGKLAGHYDPEYELDYDPKEKIDELISRNAELSSRNDRLKLQRDSLIVLGVIFGAKLVFKAGKKLWGLATEILFYERNHKVSEYNEEIDDVSETKTDETEVECTYAIADIDDSEQKQRINELSLELKNAYHGYQANMTSEEAQNKLLDSFLMLWLCMKNLNEVANAQIVDAEGNMMDGEELIANIIDSDIILSISEIYNNNPYLINSEQTRELADVIGIEYAQG